MFECARSFGPSHRYKLKTKKKKKQDFPDSCMGRDLASIRATFNGKPILIMTSHLESEKQSSNERKSQFKQVCLFTVYGGRARLVGRYRGGQYMYTLITYDKGRLIHGQERDRLLEEGVASGEGGLWYFEEKAEQLVRIKKNDGWHLGHCS